MTTYPRDFVAAADGNWCRIHEGHNLPLHIVQVDFQDSHGGMDSLTIDEVFYDHRPRVKWCSRYGEPCDSNGMWHEHWFEGSEPFTIAYRPLVR